MSIKNKLQLLIANHSGLLVVIYAVIIRLIFVIFYNTITIFPDSEDYINLSKTVFNLTGYDGKRTPGLPIIINLFETNLSWVVGFQLLLGVVTTYFIYSISSILSKNKVIGFWIAIIFTSFANVVLFDFAILTETLTTFLLSFSIWTIVYCRLFESKTKWYFYFLLSLILTWLYFTRPFFIYVPVGFALFFIVASFKTNLKSVLFKSTLVLCLPLLTYYMWNNHNKKTIGHFTNTAYFGINLTQTATPFFELVKDEHAQIRDIIVRHRDSILIHNPKIEAMSVWDAQVELLQVTNLSQKDLYFKLGDISKQVIKDNPLLYLKQAGKSWLLFWGNQSSFYWNIEKVNNVYFKQGTLLLWIYIQRYALIIFNILFLIFSLKKIILFFKNKMRTYDPDLFIVCIILSGSVAQALVAYGNNSRFCFPFFPLIVYFVLYNIWSYKHVITAKK